MQLLYAADLNHIGPRTADICSHTVQEIGRTREEIHEETGISVKTLNRTIRKLKESGMVGITKGKVTMDEVQQKMAREYVQEGRE